VRHRNFHHREHREEIELNYTTTLVSTTCLGLPAFGIRAEKLHAKREKDAKAQRREEKSIKS
jgi:hypothetical protein